MKVLLINPNRYRTPPVPPLALEYLAGSLDGTGHDYHILDLCFAEHPIDDLCRKIESFSPDIVGFTIRNIDTVIYHDNVFFLDEIRSYVEQVKNRGIPVILGGCGYSFIPDGILRYLGADWGVYGPGESVLLHLLDSLEKKMPPPGTIFNGWDFGIDVDHSRSSKDTDYKRYIVERGLAGFETQKGCIETCSYCSEGNRRVIYKNPFWIAGEIKALASRGITDFHLCDTEFNQNLDHCKNFLNMLIKIRTGIRWSLYMKTSPYDDELFRLLKKSGAHIITLSIPTGKNSIDNAVEMAHLIKKHDIKYAVDFLCGLPGDTVQSLSRNIEILRKIEPNAVGVNTHFRLYPNLAETRKILSSNEYKKNLLGSVDENPDMVKPVFFNTVTYDMLREIIGDDPLFRIEGFERTSNYERISKD